MGSIGAAAIVAELAFVILLGYGWFTGLRRPAAVMFLILGVAVYVGLPAFGYGTWVTTALAVIDIALVFAIFKGDVRIT